MRYVLIPIAVAAAIIFFSGLVGLVQLSIPMALVCVFSGVMALVNRKS
jgi:hypothetical protein